MEKHKISKFYNLVDSIRKDMDHIKATTSQVLKRKYIEKLKSQLREYEEMKTEFNFCEKCGSVLFNSQTKKHLSYQCSKMTVYLYVNVCNCGKFSIVNRERVGECNGLCRPCDFRMVLNFNREKNEDSFKKT